MTKLHGDERKGMATINDVARIAGVSKRTVSRVINNSPKVNPETRENILKIIQELNYSPSKQARGLASSRSYLVGLLYDDPNAVVIHSVQRGVLQACTEFGYELVVHPIEHNSENIGADVLRFVQRSNLDGLIIMAPISSNEQLIDALRKESIEYVRMAPKEIDSTDCMIVSCDRQAMNQVADLFVKRQCRRPAIIRGPANRIVTRERFEGLIDALKKRNLMIDEAHIAEGDFSFESGLVAAKKLLGTVDRPDAIFASNDQMAIATIHVAEDLGIKVPQDLLVVGYDDEPMASRLRPTLTTLQRPNTEMARCAALKLIANINNEPAGNKNIETFFIPQLIERNSTNR